MFVMPRNHRSPLNEEECAHTVVYDEYDPEQKDPKDHVGVQDR